MREDYDSGRGGWGGSAAMQYEDTPQTGDIVNGSNSNNISSKRVKESSRESDNEE